MINNQERIKVKGVGMERTHARMALTIFPKFKALLLS